MIKDITLGQYFPGGSLLHRIDPRMKILVAMLFIIMVFSATTVYTLAAVTVLTFLLPLIGRIPFKTVMKSILPLKWIILIMLILYLFAGTKEGDRILWQRQWHFIHIAFSVEGIVKAVCLSVRIIVLVLSTSVILSYTTSPIALADAIERLLAPLNRIKVPVHDFAMMITIALRFIPILIEETDKIMSAQASRGADFYTGNLVKRSKALIPVFIPLFVSSVRHADELATAMECRCYRGGRGRTRMKKLVYTALDYFVFALAALLLFAVIIAADHAGGFAYL